jgi:hypothetical protein
MLRKLKHKWVPACQLSGKPRSTRGSRPSSEDEARRSARLDPKQMSLFGPDHEREIRERRNS